MTGLVYRPRPKEGEWLDGYILRLAAAYRMPLKDMADHLGMPQVARYGVSSRYALDQSTLVTVASRLRLSDDRLRLLCDMALPDRFQVSKSDNTIPLWVYRGFTPFCPACMSERPGVWLSDWRVPAASVCPLHRCALVAVCPRCQHPALSHRPRWGMRWSAVPLLGTCHNAGITKGEPACRQPLSEAVALPASDADVEARNLVAHALGGGSFHYGGGVTSAADVLFDLRLTINLLRRTHQPDLSASTPELAHLARRALRSIDEPAGNLMARIPLPPDAITALITYALELLAPRPLQ